MSLLRYNYVRKQPSGIFISQHIAKSTESIKSKKHYDTIVFKDTSKCSGKLITLKTRESSR
jgi:hypothetical protein